jgi:hypothetical protein
MISCKVRVLRIFRLCLLSLLPQEASVFLKKRAAIEEEYGKNMHKLARMTADMYGMTDGKAG